MYKITCDVENEKGETIISTSQLKNGPFETMESAIEFLKKFDFEQIEEKRYKNVCCGLTFYANIATI